VRHRRGLGSAAEEHTRRTYRGGRGNDRNIAASWSRRGHPLRRSSGWVRTWPSPPIDHRTFPGRRSTDDVIVWPFRHFLQWRDLQRGRATSGARGCGTAISRALRYRGRCRRCGGLGHRGDYLPSHRHVRNRAMGPTRARALSHPRSARHQATLLGEFRRSFYLWLGTQSTACRRDLDPGARS